MKYNTEWDCYTADKLSEFGGCYVRALVPSSFPDSQFVAVSRDGESTMVVVSNELAAELKSRLGTVIPEAFPEI